MASAYLQYINEESTEILDFYYDEVLKFKYNDSKGARKMIDLIIGNVTTPFEALMNLYLFDEAGVQALLHAFSRDAKKNSGTTIRSTYDAARDILQKELEDMYTKFQGLE